MSKHSSRVILLLGGARSGKSSRAQELASAFGERVLFCATAEPLDEEMQARIDSHRKSRPQAWHTLEVARNVGHSLEPIALNYDAIIIDCVTLLAANRLGGDAASKEMEEAVSEEVRELVECVERRESNFILVSNEVGSGIVPESPLARTYRDLLGHANQLLAAHADEVYLMIAGLPMRIK